MPCIYWYKQRCLYNRQVEDRICLILHEWERGEGLERALPWRHWGPSNGKAGVPHLQRLSNRSVQSLSIYRSSPRCYMQLENLKQEKKTVAQVVTKLKQLIEQAELTTRSTSDNIHLIGLFQKTLNYSLAHKIMFGKMIPRTIEDWFKKVIQFNTNYREVTAIFGPNKKNDTRTTNRSWYRPTERKDPNGIDVDVLTFKERQTLMKQEKYFKCRKTGHRASDCPDETDRKGRRKKNCQKLTWWRMPFATIRALTKDKREAFVKMMLEGKEDF